VEVTEHIVEAYEAISNGGSKSQYENESVKVTAYRVGQIIRIDIKEKEKEKKV
jgi:hypothetical protein